MYGEICFGIPRQNLRGSSSETLTGTTNQHGHRFAKLRGANARTEQEFKGQSMLN
jgi:hypothetical protein